MPDNNIHQFPSFTGFLTAQDHATLIGWTRIARPLGVTDTDVERHGGEGYPAHDIISIEAAPGVRSHVIHRADGRLWHVGAGAAWETLGTFRTLREALGFVRPWPAMVG